MQDLFASSEGFEWQEWFEGLDLEQPLSDLIDNHEWLEPVTLTQGELAHLDELGREYAQELSDRHALPDVPPMDLPETLLEPEHPLELDHDLDFDR